MSKHRHRGGALSASQLKRRGWSSELIRDLLPPPQHTVREGNTVQTWSRAAVRAGEQSARFLREARLPHLENVPSAQLLRHSWEAAPREDTLSWCLAEHYHSALLARLERGLSKHRPRQGQASAYVRDFLSLEQHCESKRLQDIFQHFLSAGSCLAQRLTGLADGELDARYPYALHAAAEQVLADLRAVRPEAELERMLRRADFPERRLLAEGLEALFSVWYVPQAIRSSLSLLLSLQPKDEYPEARAMHRHFVLHLGGTNTGKTYAGFQRLIQAKTGVYLAPLRLLALEAQETLLDAGVDCSLSTGEEEDRREGDSHVAATAEKLELSEHYDVAVIDECQMIADAQRGYAWTRAILGVLAPEVHLCAAPEARQILQRLIESCGDSCEVEFHRRQTPLVCMNHTVDFEHVQPGDALISFSKIGVLSAAEDLRLAGKEPAIIYGALPHETRRRQMEGFLDGRMEYVVATDAIGMGLNLPIRRILFMETEKFDGVERRALKPEEIQQIAGRAGRFGMYDRGYVGAMENLSAIRAGLNTTVPPLSYAIVGFSELVLQVDYDLLEVLTEWSKMPSVEPYRKLDISRYLSIISRMREKGFQFTKEQELRAANIPFDETEERLRELFFHYLNLYQQGEAIEQPEFPEEQGRTLPELELYYRKLDLYFSFSKAFGTAVDAQRLADSRERAAAEINEILLYRLRSNIRFCASCGKAMLPHHRGRFCESCFRKRRKNH